MGMSRDTHLSQVVQHYLHFCTRICPGIDPASSALTDRPPQAVYSLEHSSSPLSATKGCCSLLVVLWVLVSLVWWARLGSSRSRCFSVGLRCEQKYLLFISRGSYKNCRRVSQLRRLLLTVALARAHLWQAADSVIVNRSQSLLASFRCRSNKKRER